MSVARYVKTNERVDVGPAADLHQRRLDHGERTLVGCIVELT